MKIFFASFLVSVLFFLLSLSLLSFNYHNSDSSRSFFAIKGDSEKLSISPLKAKENNNWKSNNYSKINKKEAKILYQ